MTRAAGAPGTAAGGFRAVPADARFTAAEREKLAAIEAADALLSTVQGLIADEIERIADERTWTTEHDNEVVSTRDLYEHVARLRGELEPVTYDFPPDDDRAALDPTEGRR